MALQSSLHNWEESREAGRGGQEEEVLFGGGLCAVCIES